MRSRLKSVGRVGAPRRVAAVMMAGALLLAVPQSAKAQGTGTTSSATVGQWTVTPVIGTAFSGDVGGPTVVLGLAGGYNWSPRITFEGEFNVLPSSQTAGLVQVDAKIWNLTGNALYHFSGRDYIPYGAFGIAWAMARPTSTRPIHC
ncbi:MAG: hypothetical protein JWL71_2826 [Acidobacteria bacterium]|nr:hypothetical protein [Acidobacteriota bacterium]